MTTQSAQTASARLSRLLALVPWLMQHDGVSIDVAAAHFGVTSEQLEKDLWLLIVCGLPGYGPDQLVDIQFWDDGIHVIDPQVLDRPLRLTEAEATSLMLAVRLLAQIPGTHDREALITLTTKLEAALDLPGELAVVVEPTSSAVVLAVQQAMQQGSSLRIHYASAAADSITERVIHPRQFLVESAPPALLAYCELAGAMRTFRIDRIHQAQVNSDVTPVDGEGSESTAATLVGAQQRAQLVLDADVRWAMDVYDMENPQPTEDGRLLVDVGYWDPRWVVRLVLGLRGAAEVVSPPALRQAVVVAAQQALAGYAGHTGS
jgi:proteasome accessory factor C